MESNQVLKNTSWNDLQNYFGSQVLSRGESYFKSKRVSNLRTCGEALLAEVQGNVNYITLVAFSEDGKQNITTNCSCSYDFDCKHAVAVILTYVDCLKRNIPVPAVKDSDPDLKLLKEEGFRKDYEKETPVKTNADESSPEQDIAEFLEKHSKESLIEIIMKMSSFHSALRQDLLDRSRLSGGKTKEIVFSIRREFLEIISKPAWHNRWSGEGNLANFSRVERNLQNLLDKGNYDAAVDLMQFILTEANSYIESCDDDGDAASQLTACLGIGFEALKNGAWSTFDKLLFALNAKITDDYNICQGASGFIDSIKEPSVWSMVAEHFYKKLSELEKTNEPASFSRNYKRDRISNILIQALQNAGRSDEALTVCETEARITESWQRLVTNLIEQKKLDQAKLAAEEGLNSLGDKYAGVTNFLRETLANLAEMKGDYCALLLLKQEDFLTHPNLSSFEALLAAAVKNKNRDEMRTWALNFLQTGKAPAKSAMKEPFQPNGRYHHKEFPYYQILIDIAEKEKRIEDLWFLYKQAIKATKYFRGHAQVAGAIKDVYPEEAIKIWCALAENQIAQTSPSAYVTAVSYFREAKSLYQKTAREKEWLEYIANISETNKRKSRFIKELRGLTGEKLL